VSFFGAEHGRPRPRVGTERKFRLIAVPVGLVDGSNRTRRRLSFFYNQTTLGRHPRAALTGFAPFDGRERLSRRTFSVFFSKDFRPSGCRLGLRIRSWRPLYLILQGSFLSLVRRRPNSPGCRDYKFCESFSKSSPLTLLPGGMASLTSKGPLPPLPQRATKIESTFFDAHRKGIFPSHFFFVASRAV